jgi:hypothetical protein
VLPRRFAPRFDCGCGVSRLAIGQKSSPELPGDLENDPGLFTDRRYPRCRHLDIFPRRGTAGSVTRLVTEAQRHAVVRGGSAETAASPGGWSRGTSVVGAGPCEMAACPLIPRGRRGAGCRLARPGDVNSGELPESDAGRRRG